MVVIASINVRGLGLQQDKISTVLHYLKVSHVSIALLCESHLTPQHITRLQQLYPDHAWFTNAPESNSIGVTFVVLPNSHVLREKCKIYYDDQMGQLIGL